MSAFSAFKSPSTTISIVALVMASTGGAFAAGHSSAPSLRTVTRSAPGQAVCPAGFKVTGGGYSYDKTTSPTIIGAFPVVVDPTHQGWQVATTSDATPVMAYAVCAGVR